MQALMGINQINLSWPDSLPDPYSFTASLSPYPEPDSMPAVRRMEVLAASREASVDAARASLYPSFEVGVSWSVIGEPSVEMGAVDPGRDGVLVFAGMSLPLGYSGNGERITAASLSGNAAVYLQLQTENEQLAARESLMNRLMASLQQLQTYHDVLIPNNEAICELAINEWISGTTDIKQVIENLNDLQSVRLEESRIYGGMVESYAQLLELDGTTTEEGEFL
jgi:outer membrane protein TolC